MRLIHRLTQYQRLYLQAGSAPYLTTVGELATILYCSERHTRTLLLQLQESGWLLWQSQAGRGKRATLTCLKNPERLKTDLLQRFLQRGDRQSALQLTELEPHQLQTLLAPHMGGQWQANTPTLRIPFYRPLETPYPLTLTGRAEQHLAQTIYAGLTQFISGCSEPQPDLAHHWEISKDGLRWHFLLRSQLRWHNGQPMEVGQILEALNMLRRHPVSQHCFSNVEEMSQPHARCLRFTLKQPDYWLAHRLAELPCRLTHPQHPEIGAGAFKMAIQSPTLWRIEPHPYYHLQRPFIEAIEYWISPELFHKAPQFSCRHPIRITLGQQEEAEKRPMQSSTSLGFCYLAINLQRKNLNQQQARRLLAVISHANIHTHLAAHHNAITPCDELLPGWPRPATEYDQAHSDIRFPNKLRLLYNPPVELDAITEKIRDLLAVLDCELEITYSAEKRWQSAEQLDAFDLILGDKMVGEAPEATLESWLRHDLLWQAILPIDEYLQCKETLLAIQQNAIESARFQALRTYYQHLMEESYFTPLFNYQYQLITPPGVNGIKLTAYGWFDFCQAWLPPPLD